jgi:anaerobic selenocysteine-containing dehydrogenase
MQINRRDFLTLGGGVIAGTALSAAGVRFLRQLAHGEGELALGTGEETWATSICQLCPGGCGIRVRSIDGWPVRIEGNPLYPLNRGGLCPKGLAGLQVLYNPDRVVGPLKRVGKRGAGQWQRIGWEEAITRVANRLQEIRQRGTPQSLAVIGGQYRGLMQTLISRFLEAFGSPNYLRTSSGCDGAATTLFVTQGMHEPMAYDLEETNYILSFGCNLLEGWWSPVRQMRAYGHFRQERQVRGKLVQVDARLSMTAAKADAWIPIQPGTDGALALGIAYTLINEDLYDKDFVAQHTFGFDDWQDASGTTHTGYKTLILREYSPGTVSRITGVPVETIIRVAREFGNTKPAIALAGRGAMNASNGLYNGPAIHCLNALVGSIDVPGGTLVQRPVPLTPLPAVEPDATAKQGVAAPPLDHAKRADYPFASSVLAALPESLLSDNPYPLDTLLVYYANPLYSSPDPERWARAWDKIPFVVSFSPVIDETAMHADLILPDHTYLERWQDDPILPSVGYPLFGIRRPVVKPLYDTQHSGDVLMQIARKIGGTVADAFPWPDFHTLLRQSVEGIYQAQRGDIVGSVQEEFWYRLFQRGGIWVPSYRTFEEFWQQLIDKGGWWEPDYPYREWNRVLRTPSGTFEFYMQNLRQELHTLAQRRMGDNGTAAAQELRLVLDRLGITAQDDRVFLPHYEPPRFIGDAAEYPFHLNTFMPMAQSGSLTANVPFLQEILGPQVNMRWDAWLEINPRTAERLGVADNDWVWVESPLGKIKTRAKHYVGAMPNVVNMPLGLGHTALGRWAKDVGVSPNRLLQYHADHLGGLSAWFSTRVKISKA